MGYVLLLTLGLVAVAGTVDATDRVPTYGARDGHPAVLLSNRDDSNPYTGIGRYEGRARCTAVFLDTFGSDTASGDAPAYAITNGHCPEFPGSNEVLLNRPARGRVIFNFFADTTAGHVTIQVGRVVYATMKGQDIAVLELAQAYRQLRSQGIEPRSITTTRPSADEFVAVVGAPVQRDPAAAYLQLSSCRLTGQASLVLEFNWHWFGFLRHSCAGVAPGSSGSPVISRRTGRMLGLVNTTTAGVRSEFTACSIDHPCEPDSHGERSLRETTYVTPIIGLNRCFDAGWFRLDAPGCPLDPGSQVAVSPNRLGHVNPTLTSVPVGRPTSEWNVRVTGPFSSYRYKVTWAGTNDCRDLRGYTPPYLVSERPVIDDRLPRGEGWWLLCVIGGDGTTASWSSVDFPAVVVVRIDTVRPRVDAPLTIEDEGAVWRITFQTLAPEIATYTFKFGTPVETSCDVASGYRPALLPFISLLKRDGPHMFCAIPYDAAGNRGHTIETLLP